MRTFKKLKAVWYGIYVMLFACISFGHVSAQDLAIEDLSPELHSPLRFDHLNSDDGLVQNGVHAILQDSHGFMWFGTEGGLSRYDGYRFLTFQAEEANPNSLTRNNITALHEDHDGMIWIAIDGGGVNRLNPLSLEFTSFLTVRNTQSNVESLPGDRPLSLFQDSHGYLWVGNTAAVGLARMDIETGSVAVYRTNRELDNNISGNLISDIIETDDGNLWIAVNIGVDRFDLETGTFTNYPIALESELKSIYQDRQGRIWAGGNQGLYLFDPQANTFEQVAQIGKVNDILAPSYDENLWLATNDGLLLFDRTSMDVIYQAQPSRSVVDSLNNTQINVLYEDDAGLIWIGGDTGLDIFDPTFNRFELYRHYAPDAAYTLAPGVTQAIAATDENILWAAVDEHLHKLNINTGDISLYSLAETEFDGQAITSIFQDQSGIVWLGTEDGRLLYLDPSIGDFILFPLNPDQELSVVTEGLNIPGNNIKREEPRGGIGENQSDIANRGPSPSNGRPPGDGPPNGRTPRIVDIYEDPQQNLWVVGDVSGVYRLNVAREEIIRYERPEADPLPNSMRRILPPITSVFSDSNGDLWFTTDNGLARFDMTTETYQRYQLLRRGADTITESIREDADGRMWIASHEGLIRLDPSTGDVKQYTTNDGLPTNYLVGIERDETGRFWISSKRGLSQFDPETEIFHNFNVADGLQGTEFNSNIVAAGPDGRLYFGGNNGLTAFHPEDITLSTYQPQVILDELELFNQTVEPSRDSILEQPIWLTDQLTLNHDQNFLSFEFAALNYVFDDVNYYRYKLDGLETAWNETDSTRRFASYTNLAPGQYEFRVQATNRDGLWSQNEATLFLTVLPPWWATSHFRLLVVCAIFGVLALIYTWRIQSIKARNRKLEKQVEEKTRELSDRTQELEVSEVQLREAKDAAEAASRAKSAFLANMSHELRSPLNAVLGFAQVTKRNHTLPVEVNRNLDVILSSGEHLLTLINQVLDLSKIEAGQMVLNEQNFDLHQLLGEIEDLFRLSAINKGLAWRVACDDKLPRYVYADVTKLRQILINLVGNAFKFTESGTVTLSVKCVTESAANDSGRLQFTITDTGPGIAEDEIATLFEAFSQTKAGIKAQEGTGLGLSISRRFAQLMNGDIYITSRLGHGTTFTVQIACHVASEAVVEPIPIEQQIIGLVPEQPSYRILVVDDKWANRQVILKLLAPLGFKLQEAVNGQEAIDIASTFRPHLIWMDIRMPVLDGIEATRFIKSTSWGQSIKIVALTASVYDEERIHAIEIGCDEFLRKPIRAQRVFNVLSEQIGVQYLFADSEETSTSFDQALLSHEELHRCLEALPATLINELCAGIEVGELSVIRNVIDQIRVQHQPLAQVLDQYAQSFQYQEMLTYLKKVQAE